MEIEEDEERRGHPVNSGPRKQWWLTEISDQRGEVIRDKRQRATRMRARQTKKAKTDAHWGGVPNNRAPKCVGWKWVTREAANPLFQLETLTSVSHKWPDPLRETREGRSWLEWCYHPAGSNGLPGTTCLMQTDFPLFPLTWNRHEITFWALRHILTHLKEYKS